MTFHSEGLEALIVWRRAGDRHRGSTRPIDHDFSSLESLIVKRRVLDKHPEQKQRYTQGEQVYDFLFVSSTQLSTGEIADYIGVTKMAASKVLIDMMYRRCEFPWLKQLENKKYEVK